MFVTLIHNAKAGKGGEHDELVEPLQEQGHEVRVFDSNKKNVKAALRSPGDVIVVAGGDGTVQKVAQRLIGAPTPIAIFLRGTANNIGKSVGAFQRAKLLASSLRDTKPRAVDAILNAIGKERIVSFESTGFGVISRLMQKFVNQAKHARVRDRDRGYASTLRALHSLLRKMEPIEIEIDGRPETHLLVEAMNTPMIGPNLWLSDAAVDDGLLDLVTVDDAELLDRFMQQTIEGATPPALPVRRVKSVELRGPAAEMHIDGNADCKGKRTRVNVEVLPAALRVIVP